LTKLLIFFRKF